ncbi:MAG: FAD binding domain-containing protein [Candidatus Eisenbacteria bacterium]|nr:FAD binding domain-containing protein [Candidatus Eisenbacteria bacterium]
MMRLPKFAYRRPTSVAEAVAIAAGEGPTAMYVAGGTDLYPNMKRRQQTPTTVIGLNRIADLRMLEWTPTAGMTIGAGLTLTELESHQMLNESYPGFADAVRTISTPQLRNMGTIGGNLCLDTRCNYYDQNYEWRKGINFCMKKDGDVCWVALSSPKCLAVSSSDAIPILCAMDARFVLESAEGQREVRAEEMYNNDGINYLHKQPGELITAIKLPPTNGWRAAYRKLRRRGAFDFPVLGVGAWMKFTAAESLHVESARIFIGGIASAPIRCLEAEALLEGKLLTDEVIQAAADEAAHPARPMDNTDHDRLWRKQMVSVWVRRTLDVVRG